MLLYCFLSSLVRTKFIGISARNGLSMRESQYKPPCSCSCSFFRYRGADYILQKKQFNQIIKLAGEPYCWFLCFFCDDRTCRKTENSLNVWPSRYRVWLFSKQLIFHFQHKVLKHTKDVPVELKDALDHESFEKARVYQLDRSSFGFYSGAYSQLETTVR